MGGSGVGFVRRVREVVVHPLVEVAMAYLVFISVVVAVVDYAMPLGEDLRRQLYTVDLLVVLVLLAELLVRALRSGSPVTYIAYNVYEIPALIPLYVFAMVEHIPSIAGLVRLLRVLRLLRLILLFARGSAIVNAVAEAARRMQFSTVLGILALTVVTSAFTVYIVELASGSSSIKSFWDSLWWALATVTTVGYGDVVPETWVGRVIGAFTMLVGIGIYSAFAGLIAATLAQLSRTGEVEEIKSKLDRLGELDEREFEELVESLREKWRRAKNKMA